MSGFDHLKETHDRVAKPRAADQNTGDTVRVIKVEYIGEIPEGAERDTPHAYRVDKGAESPVSTTPRPRIF